MTWPIHLKKTKPRVAIYEILSQSELPLSPKDILSLLTDQDIWLSTVYRVLDQFEKDHLILRIKDPATNATLYELDRHDHKHYAVCLGCHQRFAIEACPIHEDIHVSSDGFEIIDHRIEILGYCQACRQAAIK